VTLHRVTVIVDSRNEQHRTADHPTSRHQSASPARGPMEEIVGNTPEASKCISVRLFGTFEIRRNGASLFASDMGGRKPRHILEILLLNLGISVSKSRIIEMLWGSSAGGGTVAPLDSYVSGIRRAIQPATLRRARSARPTDAICWPGAR